MDVCNCGKCKFCFIRECFRKKRKFDEGVER